MAKKNLGSLMSGIIGSQNSEENSSDNSSSQDNVSARKPGRPKKETSEITVRTSYEIKADTLKKLKYISLMDDKLIKDITDEAYSDYINKWESKHGKIPF